MTTYDLIEVREFIAGLADRMTRCENDEGFECADLDSAMLHHARLCLEFVDAVRQWGRGVFTGRVAFDPEVEQAWKSQGDRLHAVALEINRLGLRFEQPCYDMPGLKSLNSALWNLELLLQRWVTPKIAVSPAARRERDADLACVDQARLKLASLAPLPADWQPASLEQRTFFRMVRPH